MKRMETQAQKHKRTVRNIRVKGGTERFVKKWNGLLGVQEFKYHKLVVKESDHATIIIRCHQPIIVTIKLI